MLPELLLSADRARGAVRLLKDFLRSGKPARAADDFPALADNPFATLDAAVTQAEEALAKDPGNAGLRQKLIFAVATRRDVNYAHAGRMHMVRLAWNNRVRGAFEGARRAVDNKL